SDRVFQIVAGVRVLIYSNHQNIRGPFALQTIASLEQQGFVGALDVVFVESVSGEVVLAGDDRDSIFERHAGLPVEHVAAPDSYQRTISKQANVSHTGTRSMSRVGSSFRRFNSYLHLSRRCGSSGSAGIIRNRKLQD